VQEFVMREPFECVRRQKAEGYTEHNYAFSQRCSRSRK